MSTREEQEEFREMLKQDAAEEAHREMEEAKKEYFISSDYAYFEEHFQDEFNAVYDNLRELKRLHKMYEHPFDIKELEDNL